MIIDLRKGFSYAGEFTPGSTHRVYDIFNAGILGAVGDTLIWQTPQGAVQGDVTETGWEDRPLPTRWVDVVIVQGEVDGSGSEVRQLQKRWVDVVITRG